MLAARLNGSGRRRTVFVIYLDPDEPTNIVESYTFTFTYETDAEGNKVSLGHRLSTCAAR